MGAQPVLVVARPTAQVLSEPGVGGHWLSAPERERMARLQRAQDRDDFLAAHALVRICVARLLGVRPTEVVIEQRCATCGGPHGRPEVAGHPDVGASLAHSAGFVAAAAGLAPVGVDVEVVPGNDDNLSVADLSIVLTPTEIVAIEAAVDQRRALRLAWVRKEACLKAGLVDLDGLGAYDLSALPLDPVGEDGGPRSVKVGPFAVHDWWDGSVGAVGAVVAPAGVDLTLA